MTNDSVRKYYDKLAERELRFAQPVRAEELQRPLAVVDPWGWLGGDIRGQRVLCLAAGGGRQSALYAAAGGRVTVVDISPEMLRLDRQVATEYGLAVTTVEASMEDLSMLESESFEVVIQPVSTCYVEDIGRVYREVARVTAPRGVYVSQHKQPTSLQATARPHADGYVLNTPYYRQGPLPPEEPSRHREAGTLEYLHRWEQLVGELCRAGFVVEDLIEPMHAREDSSVGQFGHRSQYVAPYVRIKARRSSAARPRLVIPSI